jgi:hypothetical protein
LQLLTRGLDFSRIFRGACQPSRILRRLEARSFSSASWYFKVWVSGKLFVPTVCATNAGATTSSEPPIASRQNFVFIFLFRRLRMGFHEPQPFINAP